MRKLFILLNLIIVSQLIFPQQPISEEQPLRFFNEGKQMFLDKNYVGCEHSLLEFKSKSNNEKLKVEADYMIISSMFLRGNKNAENKLKDFLEKYPETYHRNQISFFIGTSHFDKKEWEKALFWFNEVDIDFLNITDQEDYAFRTAYANLQKHQINKAKGGFAQLNKNSKKYKNSSAYYLAYIDFREGDYDRALPIFEQLKNIPEYKEEALFFIVQSYFISSDLNKAISEGENYISSYPQSKNTKEIYRILGNSYNRLHDINSSISNYEQYLKLEDKPFAEDMYLLGTSYYQNNNFTKAIKALQYAASTNNQLGQAAYMKLGQAYLQLKDYPNASMSFDAAARVNFDKSISEAASYNYALIINQTSPSLSVFDQSVSVFQRFLKEYPNSQYANQINDILASTLLSTKNYQVALSAINDIKNPSRQILQAKQIILFRLGTQNFVNAEYDLALKNFTQSSLGNYDLKIRNESYFWIGEIEYRKNQFKKASQSFLTYVRNASSNDDNYIIAYYNLGYTYFQLKNYNAALQNFNKYLYLEKNKQTPIYADALNRTGDCQLYNRNYEAAERFYSQAAATDKENAEYSEFQKAFVMGLRRNYNGKISALDKLMSRYPNSQYYDDALYEKSRALVMLNREKDAINIIEKLIREYPDSPLNSQAGVQLGQLYFNTNNLNKSIEAYKRVIKNNPKSEEARISIKSLESVYKELNDINSYASYVNSLGTGTVITASRQDSLSFLAAESIYMKGQINNSRNALKNYLQSYPNGRFSSDAHYLLGYMAFEANNKDEALNEFNYVISSNNRKYIDDALIYTSGIQFDKQQYEEAYRTYSKLNQVAATADNKNVARLGMLRSASLMHNDKEVINSANELLTNTKISPEIANEARYYRAKSYINTKQTDAAITDLQTLAQDSRNVFGAEAQYTLADIFYKWKSYDKAIQQVQSFMEQGTPHEYWMAKALIVLSDSYAAKGDNFQAKQYLESLKANYKGSEADIASEISERLNK